MTEYSKSVSGVQYNDEIEAICELVENSLLNIPYEELTKCNCIKLNETPSPVTVGILTKCGYKVQDDILIYRDFDKELVPIRRL